MDARKPAAARRSYDGPGLRKLRFASYVVWRWSLKHRPVWARFLPYAVWSSTVRWQSRWVPWSHVYRYRVERGWPKR